MQSASDEAADVALIPRLDFTQSDFHEALRARLHIDTDTAREVEESVKAIVADVRQKGDEALLSYTQKFDGATVESVAQLTITPQRLEQAVARCDPAIIDALHAAAARITEHAQAQKLESWQREHDDGSLIGERVTPLDSVGLYVPGGKAVYPSSVLMNAIPARVAGVGRIVMVVPAPGGEVSDVVLAAAQVAGVDEVYTVGGAQAIAALAYGTQTIAAVDKIVGPGNAYVAAAKRQVFGAVGIDSIAGPSEVLVYSEGEVAADWIAIDLLSQAEHDERAQAILVTTDPKHADDVAESVEQQLNELPREAIARVSMRERGLIVLVPDRAAAAEVINTVAPEHLEIAIANADELLQHVRHAGAIFLGAYSSEALGDYCAGPNHVLPTSATARFSSPLGTYDFQKRSSIIQCSAAAAERLGRIAVTLAEAEGLQAHAASAGKRIGADRQ